MRCYFGANDRPADRIAQLTDELADMTADRDEWKRRAEHKDMDTIATLKRGMKAMEDERTAHNRTLAELAKAISDRDGYLANCEAWNERCERKSEEIEKLTQERDALRERIYRIAEILTRMHVSMARGEDGTTAKLMTALVVTVDGG